MRSTPSRLAVAALLFALCGPAPGAEPVFSGPEVGEPLVPFTMRGVFDAEAGRPIDLVGKAAGKPILLVFVHEANRPSIAVTRAVMTYAARRAKDGLVAGVVWLGDDPTASEQFLRRARHALPQGVPIGVSVDGKEGPGAYGLNRNVTLTVLVGEGNKVTANFALVQPSVQADVPKILAEVVKRIGGKAPTPEELEPRPAPASARETDPRLAELLRGVIRKGAEAAEVDRAAAAIEAYVSDREAARTEVGRITRRILDAGRIKDYGTPKAQEYLRKWAERFGTEPEKPEAGKKAGG